MRQRHRQHGVAGLQERAVDREVGARAGVRLQVGVLGAEQLLGALDADLLGDVDDLAAAVVALAGVALGVLVGQRRAERGEHRRAGEVLAGDQLQAAAQPGRARRAPPRRSRGPAPAARRSPGRSTSWRAPCARRRRRCASLRAGRPTPGRRAGRAARAALVHQPRAALERRTAARGRGRPGRRRAGRSGRTSPRCAAAAATSAAAALGRRRPSGSAAGSTAAASRENSRSVKVRAAARGCRTTAAARCSRVAASTRSAAATCSATSSRARKSAPSTPYGRAASQRVRLHRAAGVPPGAGRARPSTRPPCAEPLRSPARVSRSAIGERQMLPVQTCRTRKARRAHGSGVEVRQQLEQLLGAARRRRAAGAARSPVRSTMVLAGAAGRWRRRRGRPPPRVPSWRAASAASARRRAARCGWRC